jgi:hypothetical protein
VRARGGREVTDDELDRLAAEAEVGFDLSTWTPRRGRPPLGAGTAGAHAPRLAARVPQRLHDDILRYAAMDGLTVSQLLRSLLEGYVRQRSGQGDQSGRSLRGGPVGRRRVGHRTATRQ